MRRRDFLGVLTLSGALSVCRWGRAAGGKLVVVVHPDNSVDRLGRGDIEAIFTTRKLDWPNGKRAVPFNYPARHPLRDAFDAAALHLDADEAARFWIDRRVRGGHPPPRLVPDVHTMLRVVSSLDTAVGYTRPEDVVPGVRIVAEVLL